MLNRHLNSQIEKLLNLKSYQKRIDAIEKDIRTGKNEFKIISDHDNYKLLELLTDQSIEEDGGLLYYICDANWESVLEECDSQEIDIYEFLESISYPETDKLKNSHKNKKSNFSKKEKDNILKVYNEWRQDHYDELGIYYLAAYELILDSSNGSFIRFQLSLADGYPDIVYSPYDEGYDNYLIVEEIH